MQKITLHSSLSPSNEQTEETFLFYVTQKFKFLQSNDKTVNLLIDEIHLSSFFYYKGGAIVGAAHDKIDAATSAFAFVITSIFSDFKDVVQVLPARKMDAKFFFKLIKNTVESLEKIGFKVISVITDNNSINRKAMSSFASPPQLSIVYPHPCDSNSVHILKCIRNNWLSQKSEYKCFKFPSFQYGNISTSQNSDGVLASVSSLKELHRVETESLVKYAFYTLSAKALQPSNLERQNVRLVLQIFNDFVSHALQELGSKFAIPHFHDTAVFIKIVTTWWNIVNVKSPHKDLRLNNSFQQPLATAKTEPKMFLRAFVEWLSKWGLMKQASGKLTRETYTALLHTSYALIEITEYCLNELGAKYILLGKFQTDSLETRFGQYR